MTTAVAVAAPVQNAALSLLMDPVRFDHLQRVGKMLALSPLFPEHLRKGGMEVAIANGALVMNMAHRLNEDALTVAQNIYFVGGKPGWSTSYMIAKANQCGVFSDPIDWELSGKGESLSVTAFGILSRTGKRVSVTLDWDVAREEGWTKNPKYQSIPEQMFRYRTAAFLIRLYCPEVMIGLPAQIEQELTMRDVTPDDTGPEIVANDTAPIDAKAVEAKAEVAKKAKVDASEAQKAKDLRDAEQNREDNAERHRMQKERDAAEAQKREAGQAKDAEPEQTGLPLESENKPDPEQFRGLFDLIISEINGSGPGATEGLYSEQIEQMRQSAPGLYMKLCDAMSDARERGMS